MFFICLINYQNTSYYDCNKIDINCVENIKHNNRVPIEDKLLTNKILSSLTQRQQTVVKMYYGFYSRKYTYQQMGAFLGISHQGAKNILISSLKELKKKFNLKI